MRVKAKKDILTLSYSWLREISAGKTYKVRGRTVCHRKDEILLKNNFGEMKWYPFKSFEKHVSFFDKIISKILGVKA